MRPKDDVEWWMSGISPPSYSHRSPWFITMRRLLGVGSVLVMLAGWLLVGAVWAAAAEGDTTRVSVSSVGVEADDDSSLPAMSGDGRFVAFHSEASNLVAGDTNGIWDVFVHDRDTEVTERVSVSSGGEQGSSPGLRRSHGMADSSPSSRTLRTW